MNGRRDIKFADEELDKLLVGGCVEKTIDGKQIVVCGQKIDIEEE